MGHKALLRSPGSNQCAVHREVLRGQQPLRSGLVEHLLEQDPAGIVLDQPIAVLRERRVVPGIVLDRHADKPAEQQVVAQLLDEQTLAAQTVEHLQRQRPQQLLRCNRIASALRVHRIEHPVHLHQRGVEQFSDRSQRMIARNKALQAAGGKQRVLHEICAAYCSSPTLTIPMTSSTIHGRRSAPGARISTNC